MSENETQNRKIILNSRPVGAPTLENFRLEEGFIIFDDYGHRYGEFFSQMRTWVEEGKIKFREDLVDGLENASQAFIGLLQGENFGKLVVKVANDQNKHLTRS
jgi:NADPH-dependent curcumin reductase CurA